MYNVFNILSTRLGLSPTHKSSLYMKVVPQEADESLNFDEMILEAAKSIITATSALVRAASAAQRELIDQVW